jgi:hypothetical protein
MVIMIIGLQAPIQILFAESVIIVVKIVYLQFNAHHVLLLVSEFIIQAVNYVHVKQDFMMME